MHLSLSCGCHLVCGCFKKTILQYFADTQKHAKPLSPLRLGWRAITSMKSHYRPSCTVSSLSLFYYFARSSRWLADKRLSWIPMFRRRWSGANFRRVTGTDVCSFLWQREQSSLDPHLKSTSAHRAETVCHRRLPSSPVSTLPLDLWCHHYY